MISYSLFLSENLIRFSLLFFLRATSPNPLKTPKSPSAARLAWSSVPVLGSSACPLASDGATGACGALPFTGADGIVGVAGLAGVVGLVGLAGATGVAGLAGAAGVAGLAGVVG